MKIIETKRLILREIVETDAAFVLDLLNQPSFIQNIGDRNVRTVEQARDYVESRFIAGYKQSGFGMWAVVLKEIGTVIGICGFVRRDTLPDADIGFAFLPQFEKQGYAYESAAAVMEYGRDVLKLPRVLAITSMNNLSSQKLLEKIGLQFERLFVMPGETAEIRLYST